MKKKFLLFALVAIVPLVPVADAQVNVHFVGAGSSSMYQGFGIAAYNDLALAIKNACPAGTICTAGHWTFGIALGTVQVRGNGPNEGGNSWIVWTTCTPAPNTCPRTTGANSSMDVWAYVQLDSTVGIREYLNRDLAFNPAILLLNGGGAGPLPAGTNQISNAFFTDGSVDIAVPNDVYNALQGRPLTAALTDIRAEDALHATLRVLGTCPGAPATGCNPTNIVPALNPCPLSDVGVPAGAPYCTDFPYFEAFTFGYGSAPWPTAPLPPFPGADQVGAGILSSVGPGAHTPVGFSLPGFADPFSGSIVPATIQTFAIGEAPIIVITNRTSPQGLGQIIGNIPPCAANGAGTDAVYCVDDPANGGPVYNGGTDLGYASDGSYLIRNLWDQHPYPPQSVAAADRFPDLTYTPLKAGDGLCGNPAFSATGPCKESRRPLGSLFAGYLCETAAYAFTWPLDSALQGNRVFFPTNGSGPPFNAPVVANAVPITLFEREPDSGAYNTFEYTEVRRFGGNAGNFDFDGIRGRWIYTAYLSQEDFVDGTPANAGGVGTGTFNPMNLSCQQAFQNPGVEGIKKRTTSTAEMVAQVKATVDSIGYAFFGFGNVSSISANPSYGYLMIDGVDPIFHDYENTLGEGGQTAVGTNPATPKNWGVLPACSTTGVPIACSANLIWDTTHPCAGGPANPFGCTYPHLRDGTYPAWSELRMMCDTAPGHNCTVAQDLYGAEALVQNVQGDIHFNRLGGVPDLLPLSDASLGPNSFNPPYGDVQFVRDHSALLPPGAAIPGDIPHPLLSDPYQNFIVADDEQDLNHHTWPYLALLTPQTTHQTINMETQTQLMTVCGGGPGTNSPPSAECGGDVGGWIIPAPGNVVTASHGQQQ